MDSTLPTFTATDPDSVIPYEQNGDYNDWLDATHGGITVSGNNIYFDKLASVILYQLDYDAYIAEMEAFQGEQLENLKSTVIEEYPTPIAYYFFRVERGYENNLQRLHLLRDTWEAIINVLQALVFGECRMQQLSLAGSGIKMDDLRSDSLATRISNIANLFKHAEKSTVQLKTRDLIPDDVLEEIRELNRVRNGFSHTSAKSEAQAKALVETHYSDVLAVLGRISGLRNITIMRYTTHDDNPLSIRCEVFNGARLVKDLQSFLLTSEQMTEIMIYLRKDRVIMRFDEMICPVAPFIHFFDEDGQQTSLCFFKRAKGGAYWYELVGKSREQEFEKFILEDDFNAIRDLL